MKHGEYRDALAAFSLLRPGPAGPLMAARDMYYAHAQLEVESGIGSGQQPDRADPENQPQQPRDRYLYHIKKTSYWQRFRQLFAVPRCRRAALCAATVMMARQLTGINTIGERIPTLQSLANSWRSQPFSAIYCSGIPILIMSYGVHGSALFSVLLTTCAYYPCGGLTAWIDDIYLRSGLPAYWLIETIGRSIMLLIGLPNMAWLMLVLACCFEIKNCARLPLIGLFIVLFTIAYSPTAGTSPYSISAEVFPLVNREAGHALAVTVNMTFAGLLLLTFPRLLHRCGPTASLSLFVSRSATRMSKEAVI